MVDIEISVGDEFSVDRIIIKNWIPGPRNSFGPRKCILPVKAYDLNQGCMVLGFGEYVLKLPAIYSEQKAVSIDTENNIATSFEIQKDDVILLGLDDVGRPCILGFPLYTPRPEQGNIKVWEHDALAQNMLTKNSYGMFEFDNKKIAELIRTVGGTLPMTVEHISEKGNIFLSRRHQLLGSSIPANKLSLGYLLGLLPDGETALIRCGGGILRMNFDNIIYGLPRKLFKSAEKILIASKTQLWLRTDDTGEIISGIRNDRSKDIFVETVGVLTKEETPDSNGVICRSLESGTIYWLPENFMAWTPLSDSELSQVFTSHDAFRVRIITNERKPPSLSLVGLADVQREFSNIQIGSKMSVKVLAPRNIEKDSHFLVETLTTHVILDCVIYDHYDDIRPGDFIPVEVVEKVASVPIQITTVPIGSRRFILDLPTWILQGCGMCQ